MRVGEVGSSALDALGEIQIVADGGICRTLSEGISLPARSGRATLEYQSFRFDLRYPRQAVFVMVLRKEMDVLACPCLGLMLGAAHQVDYRPATPRLKSRRYCPLPLPAAMRRDDPLDARLGEVLEGLGAACAGRKWLKEIGDQLPVGQIE